MGIERTKNSQRNLRKISEAGLIVLVIETYQATVTSIVGYCPKIDM